MKVQDYLRVLLAVIGMMGVVAAQEKKPLPHETPHELTQLLQSKVLPGWIVTYEEDDHVINFTREQPAVCYDAESNRDGAAPFKIVYWKFSMKVLPFIPQKENRDVVRQAMRQELAVKKKQFARSQAESKTKSLQPEDLKNIDFQVPDFSALEKDIRKMENDIAQIPDGYYKDLRLSWLTPYPEWKDGWVPRDDYVRRECEVVFKQADAVLSKYQF